MLACCSSLAFGPLLFSDERDRPADDAVRLRDPRGDVERAGGLRRPGLDRSAGLLRARRLFRRAAGACRRARLCLVAHRSQASGAGPVRLAVVLFHAAAERGRVRHRHVGGGRTLPSAGQPRPRDSRRDRDLVDRAQRLRAPARATPTPTGRRWLHGAVVASLFALLRSRTGAGIQAIRDNEEAAASVGVEVAAQPNV